METTVIKNPTGTMEDFTQKGILLKSDIISGRSLDPNVYTALTEIPDMKFTITDATSTEEEDKKLERKSKTHLEGRAVDVRYDDNGHQFISWITQTSEGNLWAKKHGATIFPHGEGVNAHYHIQFSKKSNNNKPNNENTDPKKPDNNLVKEPPANQAYDHYIKSPAQESYNRFMTQTPVIKEESNQAYDQYIKSPAQKSYNKFMTETPVIKEDVGSTESKNSSKDDSFLGGLKETINNANYTPSNIKDFANRGAVKYLGIGDNETDVSHSIPKSQMKFEKGYTLHKRTEHGHIKYENIFDLKEGFNYIPVPNRGNSKDTDVIKDVEGIAHFLLDVDLTKEYTHGYSIRFLRKQLAHNSPIVDGSTVKDPYVTLFKKNDDGTVNVTYRRVSEIDKKQDWLNGLKEKNEDISAPNIPVTSDGYKLADPLRQYKFSDLDFSKDLIKAPKNSKIGFQGSMRYLPTKTGEPSYLIAGNNVGNSKAGYGRMGGGSVVFLSPKADFAIDFSGSINEIEAAGKKILHKHNLKPDELIIALHDLGSFSAKPGADEKGVLKASRYRGFNNDNFTGGGLAIPKQKK